MSLPFAIAFWLSVLLLAVALIAVTLAAFRLGAWLADRRFARRYPCGGFVERRGEVPSIIQSGYPVPANDPRLARSGERAGANTIHVVNVMDPSAVLRWFDDIRAREAVQQLLRRSGQE